MYIILYDTIYISYERDTTSNQFIWLFKIFMTLALNNIWVNIACASQPTLPRSLRFAGHLYPSQSPLSQVQCIPKLILWTLKTLLEAFLNSRKKVSEKVKQYSKLAIQFNSLKALNISCWGIEVKKDFVSFIIDNVWF